MMVVTLPFQPHSSVVGSVRLWKGKDSVNPTQAFVICSQAALNEALQCAGPYWGSQADHLP